MKARWAVVALGATIGGVLAAGGRAQTPDTSRYGDAMARELASMGLEATCEALSPTRSRCGYRVRASATERRLIAYAVYSDETDSIYFYVERYLVAPPQAASTPALLRRLMELNWTLLVGKFEWNPRDGEVRLGAVLNTDSNFDRRAFRSIVLALDTVSARYLEELRALQAGAAVAR